MHEPNFLQQSLNGLPAPQEKILFLMVWFCSILEDVTSSLGLEKLRFYMYCLDEQQKVGSVQKLYSYISLKFLKRKTKIFRF